MLRLCWDNCWNTLYKILKCHISVCPPPLNNVWNRLFKFIAALLYNVRKVGGLSSQNLLSCHLVTNSDTNPLRYINAELMYNIKCVFICNVRTPGIWWAVKLCVDVVSEYRGVHVHYTSCTQYKRRTMMIMKFCKLDAYQPKCWEKRAFCRTRCGPSPHTSRVPCLHIIMLDVTVLTLSRRWRRLLELWQHNEDFSEVIQLRSPPSVTVLASIVIWKQKKWLFDSTSQVQRHRLTITSTHAGSPTDELSASRTYGFGVGNKINFTSDTIYYLKFKITATCIADNILL
jgi:hypothetical protein